MDNVNTKFEFNFLVYSLTNLKQQQSGNLLMIQMHQNHNMADVKSGASVLIPTGTLHTSTAFCASSISYKSKNIN